MGLRTARPADLDGIAALLTERGDAGDGESLSWFFRSHVRAGTVVDIRPGGPMQAPGAAGGGGIAPDLMRRLFPPLSADLLTYYLP